MVDLEKAVVELRETMKEQYLKNQRAIWSTPFVGFIDADNVGWAPFGLTDEQLLAFALAKRESARLNGVVVGRMVAKYSKTIKDVEGNPQLLEKAILVSGRMFTSGQTYVSITPCREHQDLRHADGEPVKNRPYVPGVTSPDKVQEIIDEQTGALKGFLEMQFGVEQVFDSRRGQTCQMDPIIAGVLGDSRAADQV